MRTSTMLFCLDYCLMHTSVNNNGERQRRRGRESVCVRMKERGREAERERRGRECVCEREREESRAGR